jgi:DNA processing protein
MNSVSIRTNAEEELHWLALRLVPGLGARRVNLLIERFRTPMAVFRASESELSAAGLPGSLARSIASGCTFEDAVDQQERMKAAGATLLAISDPAYPQFLREIFDPPPVMYLRGDASLLHAVMVGVVGSRRATTYGLAATERLAADLASAGLTITSGMARGIDTAAHKAALGVQGKTIAVLGCGVDIVYPSENRRLADDIAAKGLIVSEFPMGSPGYPQNFPIRNRIISGMSSGVLVVEGAQYSGSSITARLALDQGREVFAVPGNITSKMSWGPNLLIKQGAHVVQDWHDVVDNLPLEARQSLAARRAPASPDESSERIQASLPVALGSPAAQEVVRFLSLDKPVSLDTLVEQIETVSTSEIIAVLFDLEMAGLVRQLPGKSYVKVWWE